LELGTEPRDCTVQERKQNDLWSLGILLLEFVLLVPKDQDSCLQFDEDFVNAVTERIFQVFLTFLIKTS
jgi:hypothetical protein